MQDVAAANAHMWELLEAEALEKDRAAREGARRAKKKAKRAAAAARQRVDEDEDDEQTPHLAAVRGLCKGDGSVQAPAQLQAAPGLAGGQAASSPENEEDEEEEEDTKGAVLDTAPAAARGAKEHAQAGARSGRPAAVTGPGREPDAGAPAAQGTAPGVPRAKGAAPAPAEGPAASAPDPPTQEQRNGRTGAGQALGAERAPALPPARPNPSSSWTTVGAKRAAGPGVGGAAAANVQDVSAREGMAAAAGSPAAQSASAAGPSPDPAQAQAKAPAAEVPLGEAAGKRARSGEGRALAAAQSAVAGMLRAAVASPSPVPSPAIQAVPASWEHSAEACGPPAPSQTCRPTPDPAPATPVPASKLPVSAVAGPGRSPGQASAWGGAAAAASAEAAAAAAAARAAKWSGNPAPGPAPQGAGAEAANAPAPWAAREAAPPAKASGRGLARAGSVGRAPVEGTTLDPWAGPAALPQRTVNLKTYPRLPRAQPASPGQLAVAARGERDMRPVSGSVSIGSRQGSGVSDQASGAGLGSGSGSAEVDSNPGPQPAAAAAPVSSRAAAASCSARTGAGAGLAGEPGIGRARAFEHDWDDNSPSWSKAPTPSGKVSSNSADEAIGGSCGSSSPADQVPLPAASAQARAPPPPAMSHRGGSDAWGSRVSGEESGLGSRLGSGFDGRDSSVLTTPPVLSRSSQGSPPPDPWGLGLVGDTLVINPDIGSGTLKDASQAPGDPWDPSAPQLALGAGRRVGLGLPAGQLNPAAEPWRAPVELRQHASASTAPPICSLSAAPELPVALPSALGGGSIWGPEGGLGLPSAGGTTAFRLGGPGAAAAAAAAWGLPAVGMQLAAANTNPYPDSGTSLGMPGEDEHPSCLTAVMQHLLADEAGGPSGGSVLTQLCSTAAFGQAAVAAAAAGHGHPPQLGLPHPTLASSGGSGGFACDAARSFGGPLPMPGGGFGSAGSAGGPLGASFGSGGGSFSAGYALPRQTSLGGPAVSASQGLGYHGGGPAAPLSQGLGVYGGGARGTMAAELGLGLGFSEGVSGSSDAAGATYVTGGSYRASGSFVAGAHRGQQAFLGEIGDVSGRTGGIGFGDGTVGFVPIPGAMAQQLQLGGQPPQAGQAVGERMFGSALNPGFQSPWFSAAVPAWSMRPPRE